MSKETKWNISVTSTVPNKYDITEEYLKEVLNSHNHPVAKAFRDESYQKGLNNKEEAIREYYNTTELKSIEIKDSFVKGVKYIYTKDKITITSNYSISFPSKDWKMRDVREWDPGIHYLLTQYLLVATDEWPMSDKPRYKRCLEMLTELFRTSKTTVKKADNE